LKNAWADFALGRAERFAFTNKLLLFGLDLASANESTLKRGNKDPNAHKAGAKVWYSIALLVDF